MPRPVCFMVMPFRRKDTGAAPPAPATVDFDALWEKALLPAIEAMGYQPVRADQDLGAMIILQMIERLYFSDLVLADLTIANGNVYYEVGVRHAAKRTGCVLVSAEWARPLFDLNQMRQLRYPLPEGNVDEATAVAIRAALTAGMPALATGDSPVHLSLPGYPDNVDETRVTSIRGQLDEISAFQAEARAVGHLTGMDRQTAARALAAKYPAATAKLPTVALQVTLLLRDFATWPEMLAYVDALPPEIAVMPALREQRALALSETGDHAGAIGALEELVQREGDSSERQGLIGGRYKRLYDSAKSAVDRAHYLDLAIEHYERGMDLDLNDYYPSSNLPALYLERDRPGDTQQARQVATVVRRACERAIRLGRDNEWTRTTLLVRACIEGEVRVLDDLCDRIVREGPASWKLKSAIADLERITARMANGTKRARMEQLVGRLRGLLAG
jgi:hypothetical protein